MADKRITDVDFVDSLNSDESFFINQNSSLKQINKSNIVFGITNGGTGGTTAEKARENLGAASFVHTHAITDVNNLNEKLLGIDESLDNVNESLKTKQEQWNEVRNEDNYNGVVNITLSDHTIYDYNNVSSLTIVGTVCQSCGTITFSSGFSPSSSTLKVSGFDFSIGDDINDAIAGETWEFSVSYNRNNKSCIIWKNWSE